MKQLFVIVFLVPFLSGSAQKVGINMTNPEYTLDVRSTSNSDASQLNISSLDNSKFLRFWSGSDAFPDPSVSWVPGKSFLFASFDDTTFDFTEYMRISPSGDVGIGITNPEARLDLKGGDWNLDAGNAGDVRIGNNGHNLRIGVATGGGGAGISRIYSSSSLILGSSDEAQMQIDTEGETGFGTNNPNQKVHINGKLKIGDDAKAPTEGTIRFNSTNNRFEGYNGSKWINLGGSSPYGVQGTFNLPNSSFSVNVDGAISFFKAVEGKVLIKSSETIITGYDTSFPPNPTYTKFIYINLFELYNSGSWVNSFSITESGPDIFFNYADDLALSNDRILIANANGKEVIEYTYNGASNSWVYSNTFESPDSGLQDYFGRSIAIHNGMTIIGAPAYGGFPGTAYGPGKAYIYNSSDNLEATLAGAGATLGDQFGWSVDLTTNRAIVGAPGKEFGSIQNAGTATIFNKFSGNWSSNSVWEDDTPETNENYGYSVTIEDGDYFYVRENNGIDAFLVENGFWTLKETIQSQDTGYSISYARYKDADKMAFYQNSSDADKIPNIVVQERDANNIFTPISTLITGSSAISDFSILNNKIYVLGKDKKVYIFNY
ncbi:MAG: hypothetical protein P1U56_25635 [Saprospiraceae bacterium]|nr:hypothetical protein [Saprospiraceae bacterium]